MLSTGTPINTLLIQRNRELFGMFKLPDAFILERARAISVDIEAEKNPRCSDIEKALHHAAFAREKDINIVVEMVEANPRILLDKGNVITPGGLLVKNVRLYEFFLGAGDPEAAQLIVEYFDLIKNDEGFVVGAIERERQYERYRPHIEAMLMQDFYYLKPMVELIKQASRKDVTALLKNNMLHESVLRNAIIEFRKTFAPSVLDAPGMHYNYLNLLHAFQIYEQEWNNLNDVDNNYYDKSKLMWRQVIGFIMRRLPGADRCASAQGLYYLIDRQEPFFRTYRTNNSDILFPESSSDDPLVGLGLKFAIDICDAITFFRKTEPLNSELMEKFVSDKITKLTELMTPQYSFKGPAI